MSKKEFDLTRREFLLKTTMLSASTVTAPFALNLFSMNALAAPQFVGTDYKALVCVFLGGGNDHNNTVLATDGQSTNSGSWKGYTDARAGSNSNIALNFANLQPISPTNSKGLNIGREFALHPNMPEMQALFNNTTGPVNAAIVANVGPLIQPFTDGSSTPAKTLYQNNPSWRPSNLFSHSDQTSQWSNTNNTDLTKKNYGWGGLIGDVTKNSNGLTQFTCLSTSGNNLFLAGPSINQYQITSSGIPVPISGFTTNNYFGLSAATVESIMTKDHANIYTPGTNINRMEFDHAQVVSRAIAAQQLIGGVMQDTDPTSALATKPIPAPPTYTNPVSNNPETNSLAVQLHTVARIISGHTTLTAHRQVFFVTLGGFDTHDFQATNQANLLAKLSQGIKYFYDKIDALGLSNNVTLFTASDFGRTFRSNGDGTDHGWGSHHFVVGGAVNGKDIYGNFPATTIGHDRDVGSGNLVPEISVDQYAATMAKWFGVPAGPGSELASIFPNIGNFDPVNVPSGNLGSYGSTDLGFMKPA